MSVISHPFRQPALVLFVELLYNEHDPGAVSGLRQTEETFLSPNDRVVREPAAPLSVRIVYTAVFPFHTQTLGGEN